MRSPEHVELVTFSIIAVSMVLYVYLLAHVEAWLPRKRTASPLHLVDGDLVVDTVEPVARMTPERAERGDLIEPARGGYRMRSTNRGAVASPATNDTPASSA